MPAISTLHADPGARLTLAGAAARCGLSRSAFTLVFRRSVGLSFHQFCVRTRTAHAAIGSSPP